MVQWVKRLSPQLVNVNLFPRPTWWKKRTSSHKLPFDLHMYAVKYLSFYYSVVIEILFIFISGSVSNFFLNIYVITRHVITRHGVQIPVIIALRK